MVLHQGLWFEGSDEKVISIVPSNIAEGDNLDTDKQSVRHFYIARGSVAELSTQLIIGMEIGYIEENKYNSLETECGKISAMLTSLIKFRSKA